MLSSVVIFYARWVPNALRSSLTTLLANCMKRTNTKTHRDMLYESLIIWCFSSVVIFHARLVLNALRSSVTHVLANRYGTQNTKTRRDMR